jgi:hypothetical protein
MQNQTIAVASSAMFDFLALLKWLTIRAAKYVTNEKRRLQCMRWEVPSLFLIEVIILPRF